MALGTANAYWEITPVRLSEGMQFGIATQAAFPNSGSLINGSSNSFTVNNGGDILVNGTVSSTGNPSFAVDETVAFTWEGSTGTFAYSVDGANFTNIAIDAAREQFVSVRIGNDSRVSTNFGQQPFIYTPPAGFEALQTQNLPAATIANGRDHFQAITGPGDGADGTVVAGQLPGGWSQDFTFSDILDDNPALHGPLEAFNGNTVNGFVSKTNGNWTFAPSTPIPVTSTVRVYQSNTAGVTSWNGQDLTPNATSIVFNGSGEISRAFPLTSTTAGAAQSCFCRGIEVDGELLVDFGILPLAQRIFPNGLWWIKDRVNSNQHQFVDSVTNASQGGGNWANTSPTISQAIAYAAPAGNSVAWCWNAAEPATSGFNIVQYTGQNPTTTTVPHGLPGIPDMIITQAKTGTTRNYAVFHSALGEGQWLQLNGSDQALADATMWANTAPDETNFFVGAANTTNFSGAVYTAYCWTAIPGHSAFGSFQGNSDTNGVFVYLGFRPQMLMIRTTGAGDSFFMLDSTRSPNNPIGVDGLLNAGSTDPEGTWSARDIDFLSNGFKLRSSSGSVNGGTVVYAAWAENPFGGSNVSPANAR
jgi:hypothetical protein